MLVTITTTLAGHAHMRSSSQSARRSRNACGHSPCPAFSPRLLMLGPFTRIPTSHIRPGLAKCLLFSPTCPGFGHDAATIGFKLPMCRVHHHHPTRILPAILPMAPCVHRTVSSAGVPISHIRHVTGAPPGQLPPQGGKPSIHTQHSLFTVTLQHQLLHGHSTHNRPCACPHNRARPHDLTCARHGTRPGEPTGARVNKKERRERNRRTERNS
jgi:hypothetical protein